MAGENADMSWLLRSQETEKHAPPHPRSGLAAPTAGTAGVDPFHVRARPVSRQRGSTANRMRGVRRGVLERNDDGESRRVREQMCGCACDGLVLFQVVTW